MQFSQFTDNEILAALSAQELDHLRSNLKLVYFEPNENIFAQGDVIHNVYFTLNSVVYLFSTTKNGAIIGDGVVGSDGMLGISVLMGELTAPNHARALTRVKAFKISAELLKKEINSGKISIDIFLKYIHKLYVQSLQTTMCFQQHTLRQRICRWLVMIYDRTDSETLVITQEFISQMLGTNRPYITAAISQLSKDGIIKCLRRKVIVSDRRKLEASCCECYEIMK